MAVIAGAVLLSGFSAFLVLSLLQSRPLVDIKLKRYTRDIDGTPVAWLILSNQSGSTISLQCDWHPVSTALTECEQKIGRNVVLSTNSSDFVSPAILRPRKKMPIRALLPTNGYPVRLMLRASIEREGRINDLLRPVRDWLYKRNILSPIIKIPVPFELKGTNVVTHFVE